MKILLLIACLALAGCDYLAGGYHAADGHAAYVMVQPGGSLASQCVADLVVTPVGNALDVAAAIAPLPGAVIVIAGWTLPGLGRPLTYQDCVGSWQQVVEPSLGARGVNQYCDLRPDPYYLCDTRSP